MNLITLLDKNDRVKVSIINQLMNENLTADLDELQLAVGVSKYVFDNNLSDLDLMLKDDKFNMELVIDYQHGKIELKKSNVTNFSRFYADLFAISNKYQIIKYFFNNQNFSLDKILVDLGLSRGAFFRDLKEINEIVKEFRISFKNNQINGDLLQICYFYLGFFWNSLPMSDINKIIESSESHGFLTTLQKDINYEIDYNTRMKINLWIHINQRISLKKNYQPMQLDEDLFKGEGFAKVQEAYDITIGSNKIMRDQVDLHVLYLFVGYLLRTEKSNLSFSLQSKAYTLNSLIIYRLYQIFDVEISNVPVHIAQRITNSLLQLHLKLFFFVGEMGFLPVEEVKHEEKIEPTTVNKDEEKEIKSLIDIAKVHVDYDLSDGQIKTLTDTYLFYGNTLNAFSSDKIRVGYLLNRNFSERNAIITGFQQKLSSRYNLEFEHALSGHSYDVFMSDSTFGAENYSFNEIYLINFGETVADIEALGKVFDRILAKKKEVQKNS